MTDPLRTPETERRYRTLTTEELRRLRRAFLFDQFEHGADQNFLADRLRLIDTILVERGEAT